MFRQGAPDRWTPLIVIIAGILIVLSINPVGYIGGGRDDAHYLEAARCWAMHGPCLPTNHWEGRWPVFAPITLLTSIFGETRTTVEAWPLLCGLTALLLVVRIGQQLGDRTAGLIAALLILASPSFAIQLFRPSVEPLEIMLILAGTVAIFQWRQRPLAYLPFLCGLCFGIAFQVRETSLVAAGLIVIAFVVGGVRPRLSDLSLGCLGFFLPFVIEMLIYQQAVGDAFYRRRLSLGHIWIQSSELQSGGELAASPILNRDVIAGWRRDPGVHVHWLVDGPLNLLLDARAGYSLVLAPLLLIALRSSIGKATRRLSWGLLTLSALYIAVLTYVLAIDPKPRVLLMALTGSALALAFIATELWSKGHRLLIGCCLALIALSGSVYLWATYRPVRADRQAAIWAAQYPDKIEIDELTRRAVTLVPETRRIPGLEADRQFAMTLSGVECGLWVERAGLGDQDLIVAGQRSLVVYPLGPDRGAWLCLFKYAREVPAETMNRSARRSWGSAAT